MVFCDPLITVSVNGAGAVTDPRDSRSPGGSLAMVMSTVFGCSCRTTVWVNPLEPVAASTSSSHDGYSWSGATKLPSATPSQLWTTWVWQVEGSEQCLRRNAQWSAEDGKAVPS